jgi:DNA adenine methylase
VAQANPVPTSRTVLPRPFLKWAGGKSQLLDQLWEFRPGRFARYHEPFLGGGAFFFRLQPERALLSDVNAELINCYETVRDKPKQLLTALKKHTYDEEHFYQVRDSSPKGSVPRAARTIFLNKTAFNGLYRVNSQGKFNVPFGRYKKPLFRDPETINACSAALRSVDLSVCDFEKSLARAKAGDFVYLDPPYVPVSNTADFTSYAAGGFGWNEQERLARAVALLDQRGVKFMLSNSDVPALRSLYKGFRIEQVLATRRINSRGDRRGNTPEIVVLNYR